MSRALIGYVVSRYADVRERDTHADISLPQPVPETVRSQRSPFVMGVKRFASLNLLTTHLVYLDRFRGF